MSNDFWDMRDASLICCTSDQHGMMALHREKPKYHPTGKWVSNGRVEIGLRTDAYQPKDAPNSLIWRPGHEPKLKPVPAVKPEKKVKGLTVSDQRIVPLTVSDQHVVPMTVDNVETTDLWLDNLRDSLETIVRTSAFPRAQARQEIVNWCLRDATRSESSSR